MNDWEPLRKHTQARIGLGRAGSSLPTRALLAFQDAHARARDAVHTPWQRDALERALQAAELPYIVAHSRAHDRSEYLQRPDLGRALHPDSVTALRALRTQSPHEVAIILSDGLSAAAAHAHGFTTVVALQTALARTGISCAPLVLAPFARVALSDEIGEALGVRAVAIVIGERPGLSAADSLGIYLTYAPRPGNTDAQRNCISNIRAPLGLAPQLAADQLARLLTRALSAGVSGIALKDDSSLPVPRVGE